MVMLTELVVFQYFVKVFEISSVESNECFSFQYGFMVMEFITGWEGPEESPKTFDVAGLLKNL